MTRGKPPSPERLALIRRCMEEGWPITETMATHKVDYYTIRKYFPEYPAVSRTELGQMGAAARRLNTQLRKQGIRC
jgi:hypothetical protein